MQAGLQPPARGDAPRPRRDDHDLLDPPPSRPTWATLGYAAAFVSAGAVLLHWPAIARFLGI